MREQGPDNLLEDFWREYAKSYDKILPLTPFYQVAVARHVRTILSSRSKRVLDVGCGTGNVAVPLAYSGLKIDAIDNCCYMLDRLKKKMAALDLNSSIEITRKDAAMLDVESGYDAVNCLLALFCMNNGKCVLEKMVNNLRAGGIICLTEPTWGFQEEPLLEHAYQIIFSKLGRNDLQKDWDVVSNAGKTLGKLIRYHSVETESNELKIRADDIPVFLKDLGCEITQHSESHLGQCRFIVACKLN